MADQATEKREQKGGWFATRGSKTPMWFNTRPSLDLEPCDPPKGFKKDGTATAAAESK